MQIDFHHAVTYVIARLAKFSVEDAQIISYASQYVDDAVNSGTVKFRNRAMYSRISSAHKTFDYRNFEELANHFTWVPFHFLPGNAGLRPGKNPEGSFIRKIVCKPDSFVAKEMVASCIADQNKNRHYRLHRLGITMHVLADTFAHQGFAGVSHEINKVYDLKEIRNKPVSLADRLRDYFGDMFDKVKNTVVSSALPLGHGGALTCPDLPFMKWEYTNGLEEPVVRDNTDIFMDAVQSLYEALVRYREKKQTYALTAADAISDNDLDQIRSNFTNFTNEEEEIRHKQWLDSIANGEFSFCAQGEEIPWYIPKGFGSWKHTALDTTKEIEFGHELYRFTPRFMVSNWKYFHDALQVHRIDIIRNILPKYGICVA